MANAYFGWTKGDFSMALAEGQQDTIFKILERILDLLGMKVEVWSE